MAAPTDTKSCVCGRSLAFWASVTVKQSKYNHGAHTVYRLQYHLVWIPKYRKRILRGDVVLRLKKLFYECAAMNDWWIAKLNIMPDHVHMLVQLPPTTTVANAVKIFKGGSSRSIRAVMPELQEWLWGDSFWATGYFAESVGRANEQVIQNYIENQRDKPGMPQQRSLGL